MTEEHTSFEAGIDFESVLRIISKQIYETPLAFLRENVQNAVDAVRIQAHREQVDPADGRYQIEVTVNGCEVRVRDNGIGMTKAELQTLFWTIGSSGKRTPEAAAAGCVGTFGIGGFANFGICNKLEVISKTQEATHGTLTHLSQDDIQRAGARIPTVTVEASDDSAPRGTIVVGHLRNDPNVEELRRYLRDFVRFVPIAVFFKGEKLSQAKFTDLDDKENLNEVSAARSNGRKPAFQSSVDSMKIAAIRWLQPSRDSWLVRRRSPWPVRLGLRPVPSMSSSADSNYARRKCRRSSELLAAWTLIASCPPLGVTRLTTRLLPSLGRSRRPSSAWRFSLCLIVLSGLRSTPGSFAMSSSAASLTNSAWSALV
ncbi:MAG: ATP-binding protein [Candidatus Thiodiazotropha sp. (ex. Lucinoma kazani)]